MDLQLTPKREVVGCAIIITVPWKDSAFKQLASQKGDIENELGYGLEWSLVDDRKYAYIRREEPLNPKDESLKPQDTGMVCNNVREVLSGVCTENKGTHGPGRGSGLI